MKCVMVLTVCLLACPAAALADDLLPPIWRGEDLTVFAEWDTWDGFNNDGIPFVADEWYSLPAGLEAPDAAAYDTAAYLDSFQNRAEVVEINGSWQLDFLLPNFGGQEFTEINVQLTYWVAEATQVEFLIDTFPYTDDINGPMLVGSVDQPDGWVTEAYVVTVLPSVDAELITLDFAAAFANPVYVDQVVIDSVAAPEPASLVLLAVAGAAVRRRRR